VCDLNIPFSITYYWCAWNTVLKYALRLLDKLENFCNKFHLHIKFILIYIKMLQNISGETLTSGSMPLSLLHIKMAFQSQITWKGLFYSTSLYYPKYKSWHSPSESWCLYIHIRRDTTNSSSLTCFATVHTSNVLKLTSISAILMYQKVQEKVSIFCSIHVISIFSSLEASGRLLCKWKQSFRCHKMHRISWLAEDY